MPVNYKKFILYPLAAVLAFIILVFSIGFISTHLIKKSFINIASEKTGKTALIEGEFSINYSLKPSVEISGFRLLNKSSLGRNEFLSIDKAQLKIEILPLIRKKIIIDKINLTDIAFNPEVYADGTKNWNFPDNNEEKSSSFNPPAEFSLNELKISNIAVNYRDQNKEINHKIEIKEIFVSAPHDKNINASATGSFIDNFFEFNLGGSSYRELIDPELLWQFDIVAKLGTGKADLTGSIKNIFDTTDLGLNLQVFTEEFDLGPALTILGNVLNEQYSDYSGRIGLLELELTGINKSVNSIPDFDIVNFVLKDYALNRLNKEKGKFEKFISINNGVINYDINSKTNLEIDGYITGLPLKLTAAGCDREELLSENNCAVKLKGIFGNSDLKVNGHVKLLESELYTELAGKLIVPDIHQYDFLFDLPEGMKIPAEASFVFTRDVQGLAINNIDLKFGSSELRGNLENKLVNGRRNFLISFNSDMLNLNEILAVLPKHDDENDSDHSLRLKVFPNKLTQYDAVTNIDLNNVTYHNLTIFKFQVNSNIADNKEKNSQFILNTEDGNFRGTFDLNLAPELPVAKFNIESRDVDIGRITHDLRIAENVNFKTRILDMELEIKGSTLEQILRNSSLKAVSSEGVYIVKDLNTDSEFEIVVNTARLKLFADKPILLLFDGFINEQPVNIKLEAEHIIRSISFLDRGKIPIKITANFDRTDLIIEGFAVFPLNRKTSEIKISVSGENLNDLNLILGKDMPDIGPYSFNSDLKVTDEGYLLDKSSLELPDTRFSGFMEIITARAKPYFNISINAEIVSLDDLFLSTKKARIERSKETEKDRDEDVAMIPDLAGFDTDFEITINKIILGGKDIGNFEFSGAVKNGELTSKKSFLNLLGGEAEFDISSAKTEDNYTFKLNGYLKNYNYAPIAQLIDPESKSEGKMDFDLNVKTTGTTFKELDDNMDGEIALRIIPTSMDASLVNIWALGLINNLIPNWTRSEIESPRVNCLIGNLKVKDGIIRPDDFKIDTTNVRISVVGRMNLINQRINLVFRPLPKRTQLFSLGIPVRVVGTVENHHTITDPYNVGWYLYRLVYAGYGFIAEKLTNKFPPEDGSDLCGKEIVQ